MKLVIRQERIRHGWTQEYATKKLGIRLLLFKNRSGKAKSLL